MHTIFSLILPLTLLILSGVLPPSANATETITLNAEDDWAPYSYVAAGKIQGFAPTVISAAFASQGIKVKYNAVPFTRCLRETLSGAALGCFDIEINSENEQQYHFHKTPLFVEGLSIFAKSPHRKITVPDLEGHTVAITNGYTYPPLIMNNRNIIKDGSPSDEVQFKKLLAGRVQYALVNSTPAKLMQKNNQRYRTQIIEVGLVNQAKFYIGFSKKHPDGLRLRQVFEQGLSTIKANGQYAQLEQQFKASLQ